MAAGEVADLRVVAVHDERASRAASATASRQRAATSLELAVAVELVAEEVAEQQRLRPHAPRDLGQRRLVDLEQAELGVARRGAGWRRRPETRFAPELLCATRTRGRRISATIAAVVVLPFVAETSTEPCGRRAASRSIAPGIELPEQLPRQRRAAAAPGEARERARGAQRGGLERERERRAHANEP